MASDEKRSAVDELLDGPTVVCSDADIDARIALKARARDEVLGLRAENARLIAEARRARELVHYVMHEEDCPQSCMTDAEGDCSCGLSALLRREDERG